MARTIRIALSGSPGEFLTDFDTGRDPEVWNNDVLNLKVWLGSFCGVDEPYDVTDIDTLTLEIRASQTSNVLLFAPIELDGSDLEECELSDWQSGDSEHGVFEFADGDLVFDPSLTQAWFSFRASLVAGGSQTFGAGYVKILNGGTGTVTALALTTATLDSDGMLTISSGAISFRITPQDVTAYPDYTGSSLVLLSTTPDDDGMLTVAALGISFRVPANTLTP